MDRDRESLQKQFEEEHRQAEAQIRDLLTGLESFDTELIQQSVSRLNTSLGPHFRYEEEALYPALKQIHGRIYVKRLYDSHEGSIHTIRKLTNQLNANQFTKGSIPEAKDLANGWLLPHVSDCAGLTIVFDDLSDEQIREIDRSRTRARDEGINLLEWDETTRKSPDFGTLNIYNS